MVHSNIKRYINIECLIVALLFGGAVFTCSKGFTDKYIAPKYYFTQFCFLISLCVLSIKFALGKRILINCFVVSVILTIICSAEAIYTILQYLPIMHLGNQYPMTGHFDNPAGLISCLCIGLPFVFYVGEKVKSHKILINICITVIFVAVVLSLSRTGIIISIILILNSLLDSIKIKKNKWIIILLIAASLIIISYHIKTQSADGRILIWRSSLKMGFDAPFIGYGIGGFKKLYMDYQALFLSSVNSEKYNLIADNTLYPFNEFINLYLCFGVLGYLLLVLIIIFIKLGYKKSKTQEKRTALLSLITLSFISFFSYPFKYPFTYLICILNLYILLKDLFNIRMVGVCRMLAISLAVICLPLIYIVSVRINGEYGWRQAYDNKDLTLYESLLPILGDNPLFLYNYSAELFQKCQIEESLEVALLCNKILSSYDLELLLGDIYFCKQEYELAEKHYIYASKMCPCRFMPLNQLYDLYNVVHDKKKAMIIAQNVVNKPIKIKSTTVLQIKYKMLQVLKSNLSDKTDNVN